MTTTPQPTEPTARAASPGALRVLVVMPLGVALGGGEEMLRHLLRNGRGLGVEWMVVFLRDGPLVAEFRALGVECHLIDAGRFRDVVRRVGAVRRVAALARERRVALILGWMVAGQATAGPAALIAGVPCVWYQVGTPRPDWLDRFSTLFPARGVLVLSREGAAAQKRIWPGRQTRLVYPGVPLDALEQVRAMDPVALRSTLGLPRDVPLVGIVGRLQRWKGIHVFLDAVAEARQTRGDLHAVVVGGPHETEPAYLAELGTQAERLGISGAVKFVGFQSNATVWMQAMDVVVHASDHEPFGIVVVEAMALGKPVVAGAAGGPTEIVTDGTDGLLAPYGDSRAVAAAMLRFLAEPGFAAACGGAARARAQQFSDIAYARNVVRVLRDLAGTPEP